MINKIRTLVFSKKVLNVPETPIDERDWSLTNKIIDSQNISELKEFSRRSKTLEVKNQGSIGSCVGHSGRIVYGDTPEFKNKEPSAMWIYKKAKQHDPFPGESYSGTTIRGACKALIKEGCCEEHFWPYQSSENTKMLEGAKENASKYKIKGYYVADVKNHDLIKNALMNESLWCSFSVHSYFYQTPRNGIVDSEKYLKSEKIGGHAVALVGWKYINNNLYWEFQNSWGRWFGDKGFFFMEAELYEKILLNHTGPIYIYSQSESKEWDQRQEREQAEAKKAKIKKILKKLLHTALGFAGVGLLAWLLKN